VSTVQSMDLMFNGASSLTQVFCGPSWIASLAHQDDMFTGSSGSIATEPCAAPECETCVPGKKGEPDTCCRKGGSWEGKCGNGKEYTKKQGREACKKPECETCVPGKKGKPDTCCRKGGSWEGKCGNGKEYTKKQGEEACASDNDGRVRFLSAIRVHRLRGTPMK